MQFVGRREQFAWLDEELERVTTSHGRFVAVRGRRQVGKSRLLTEWLTKRNIPHVYYQALNRTTEQELQSFGQAVARSTLGTLSALARSGTSWPTWHAAFDAFAVAAIDDDQPVVVVIDEFPYLIDNDPSLEATLQAAWDQSLQHTGVLLVIVGSDLAMMEAMASYGRPLYQRIDRQLQIDPLNPAEVGDLLGASPTEAFDTYLVTGGFPKVVASRAEHGTDAEFLRVALSDDAHPLVFTGTQMLAAEFPAQLGTRSVLEAIGAGERSFGTIQNRAGLSERWVAEALRALVEKRIVSAEDPLSTRSIRNRARYTVTDPYLRFWLRFLADRTADISRGRGDLVARAIADSWQDYAGVAVEPLIRDSIERLLPDRRFGTTRRVGSYWTRDNSIQVDLVGTDGGQKPDHLELVGSVKWRSQKRFGPEDAADLESRVTAVPGCGPETLRVGVSRTGFTSDNDLDIELDPSDLIEAWR